MTTVAETEKLPRVRMKRFRVEDFHRMTEAGILPEESGWEIIDGYLIDKMTIGGKDAGVVKRLTEFLRDAIGKTAIISVQDPIHLDEYNEPEPDIALLCRRSDFYAESHPTPEDVLLLIEVSDSTIDREVKKNLYAGAGINEFWVVNLPEATIEVYSQPKNGAYRLVRILEAGETVESGTVKNLSLTVNEILGF